MPDRSFHGPPPGKWALKAPRKTLLMLPRWLPKSVQKSAYDQGLRKVKVYMKGPGAGRESAIRTIHTAGIEVSEIRI